MAANDVRGRMEVYIEVLWIVVSIGLSLLLLTAVVAANVYLAFRVQAGGSPLPDYVSSLVGYAATFLDALWASWKSIAGGYLFFLGVFLSICELLAKQRHLRLETLLFGEHQHALRRIRTTLVVGFVIIGLLLFFFVLGRDRAGVAHFARQNVDVLATAGFWEFFGTLLGNGIALLIAKAGHTLVPVALVLALVVSVQAVWSFGSYGILRGLAWANGALSRMLRLKGGTAPLASISIAIAGALVALL